MANKLVNLRMSDNLIRESMYIAREFGFNNIQDLIKESLRNTIWEYKKKKALVWLERNFASMEKTKRLTKEERQELFENFSEKKSDNIFKRLKIKPDVV